jgi:hypothetical protein
VGVGEKVGTEKVSVEVREQGEGSGGREGLERQQGGAPRKGGVRGTEPTAEEGVEVERRRGAGGPAEGVEEFAGGEVVCKGHGEVME